MLMIIKRITNQIFHNVYIVEKFNYLILYFTILYCTKLTYYQSLNSGRPTALRHHPTKSDRRYCRHNDYCPFPLSVWPMRCWWASSKAFASAVSEDIQTNRPSDRNRLPTGLPTGAVLYLKKDRILHTLFFTTLYIWHFMCEKENMKLRRNSYI